MIGDALQLAAVPGCAVSDWADAGPNRAGCEVDLSPAYAKQCTRATRGVIFDRTNGAVTISDVIEKPAGDVRWAVVTDARIKIDGKSVMLEKNGKCLILQRDDNMGGDWREFSLLPPTTEENRNEGFRMLGFHAARCGEVRLRVSWHLRPEPPQR
jgi:hypothetical protein